MPAGYKGRSNSSIGTGIPDPPAGLPVTLQEHRHRIPHKRGQTTVFKTGKPWSVPSGPTDL